MTKINQFLDINIGKILIIFLGIQPLIDLITSLMVRFYDVDFTMGIILRSLVLLVFSYYVVFVAKIKWEKLSVAYFFAIIIYIFIYSINIFIYKDSSLLFAETKLLIKAFYFPTMLFLIINIFNYKRLNFKDYYFMLPILIYIGLFILANITKTTFASYSNDKTGNVGWLYAANEVGSIKAIIFPIILFFLTKLRNKFIPYLILVAYIVICLQIGTKAPFLGIIITLFISMVYYFVRYILTRNKINIVLLIFPIIVISMFVTFISPYTPVGKNLGMHLKLVNVDGLDDFFNKDNKDNNKMNVIYSSRDKLLEKTHKNFNSAPLWQKITGIGFVENYGTPQQNVKTIEMDFHDIFYRFGVLGFFIYLSLPMIILYNCFKKVIVKFKNCFFNTDIISYIIAILLGLSIAALAGHVLTAPAVSIYLVYIIIMLDRELNKMED